MRTLIIQNTPEEAPPQELYDIIRNHSAVVLITEAPDEGFRAFVDRVVVWNEPEVQVDDRRLCWPKDSEEVRQLFETTD